MPGTRRVRRWDTLLAKVTAEKQEVRLRVSRRQSTRRMWSLDELPMVRCFMRGPRWKSTFGVCEVPIAEIDPEHASWHRLGRKLLMFTLEDDVRELVFTDVPELRPGVYAEW